MKKTTKYKIVVPVFLVVILILLVIKIISPSKYYLQTSEKYKSVEVGMTKAQVSSIFSDYKFYMDINKNKTIYAQEYLCIPVKLRYLAPDFIRIYFRDDQVVGKHIISYDPYPPDDFPREMPKKHISK